MSFNVSDTNPRLVEAILRKDFYSFIQAVFPIASPNSAFLPNWHLEAMAYHLTRILYGDIRRLTITVPPRSLKSICASVAFPAFALGHNPGLRIHLRKLCRRPRVCAREKLSRDYALRVVSTALSADANPFGSRQSDGIRNNLRRLPAVDFGWRNSDWARRKFRHYRRSDEGAGRVFSTRARDSKRMVGTNFTLTTRQQIHQFNHPRDAATPR